jgi:hypothetical protein
MSYRRLESKKDDPRERINAVLGSDKELKAEFCVLLERGSGDRAMAMARARQIHEVMVTDRLINGGCFPR